MPAKFCKVQPVIFAHRLSILCRNNLLTLPYMNILPTNFYTIVNNLLIYTFRIELESNEM